MFKKIGGFLGNLITLPLMYIVSFITGYPPIMDNVKRDQNGKEK